MWNRRQALRILLLGSLALMLAGCGGTGRAGTGRAASPDHAAALEADLTGDGVGPDVVACVLGLATVELERGPLSAVAVDEALLHCDTARLAAGDTGAQAIPDTELALTDVAWDRGDDPRLDDLWDRCEQGDGAACDELFQQAAVGSLYEDFGVSCGRRPDVLDCRELDVPAE